MKLLILLLSFSFASPSTMKMWEGDKYIDVQIKTHSKLRFSSNCIKGKKISCDAFTATKKKVIPREPQAAPATHPAVSYCHDKGGYGRILISADNKQYDYCRFKDGSMIDAWDLYNKHFPN